MNKINLFIATASIIVSLIPWLISSVVWYWKLISTLFILIALFISYCFYFDSKISKLKSEIGSKEKEMNKVKCDNEKLKKEIKLEIENRKNVARLYGSCEDDSNKFIADLRVVRNDLYNIYIQLNQNKTRKDSDLIKEFARKIKTIDRAIERENNYGRERNISNNQSN